MVVRDPSGSSSRQIPTYPMDNGALTRGRAPAGPPRPRLLDALSGEERLVLVQGSRLSGKTTLLRHWALDSILVGARAGIVAPEPDITDRDYWASVVNSVGCGGTDDDADPFAVLCSVVASLSSPLTLLLDDVHLVPDPEVRIRDLLRAGPAPLLRVIATSRTAGTWDGPNALPPDRAVLSPDKLRLTRNEISDLLSSHGIRPDRPTLALLEAETDGMAGLVDAVVNSASTLGGSGGPDRARMVIDGLVDRALTTEASTCAPSLARSFILCSAAAHPLTPAALSVLPGAPAGEPLRELGLLGLLAPENRDAARTDAAADTAPACHMPPALRASLLRLAHNDDPELLRDSRILLAGFWLDEGHPHTALVHAIDAADWDLVLEILRGHWQTLYTSHFMEMDRELSRIPDHLLRSDPLFDRLLRMHQRFSVPKDDFAPALLVDLVPDLPVAVDALMRAIGLRMNGYFDAAAAECDQVDGWLMPDLNTAPQSALDSYAFACVHVGICYLTCGRFGDAIAVLRRGHRAGAGTFLERDAAGKLALAHAILGRLSDAEWWIDAENQLPPLAPDSEKIIRPAGAIAAVLTGLDRLDTELALDLVSDLGSPDDREEFWGFTLYSYGHLALLTGAPADGLRYVEQQMSRFPTMHDHGAVVGPLLDSVRADLLLALERPEAADDLLRDSTDPHTAAARGRVRLHLGDPVGALAVVDRNETELGCTARDSLELSVLGAVASLVLGRRADSLRYLGRAITQSHLSGLLRPFVTAPASFLRVMAQMRPDLPVDPSTTPSVFPEPPAYAGSDHAAEPRIEALTTRERAILGSLASGSTNRQIATEHFVSLNTVKSQLRSIYTKLRTSTRAETVAVARRLDLV